MPRKSGLFPIIPLALLASLACSVFSGGGGGTETAATETQPAGGGATREKMGTPLPDAAASETPKPADDDGKSYLGDYFSTDGYIYAALELADPAEPGLIYDPVEGMRLVGVRIEVGNQKGERIYFSISDIALIDAEGDKWEAEYGSLSQEITSAYLDPGERVQGWLGFTIPEDARPVELEYLYDWMDEKTISVPLEEPPAGRGSRTIDFTRAQFGGPGLGQAVKGSGFSLRTIQVEDPAEPAFPDYFNPPANTHLLAVEIEVGNLSEETASFSSFEITLVDTDGYIYLVDYFNGPEVIESGDILPDDSVSGWVTFLVPDGTVPESIKFFMVMMDEPLWAGVGE